jgi:hypothetical protein
MGISKLRKLIGNHVGIVLHKSDNNDDNGFTGVRTSILKERKRKNITEAKPVKIAVDMMNYINAFRSNVLTGIGRLMIKILTAGIIPVCVFDGKYGDLKHKSVEKKRFKRKKYANEIEKLTDEIKKIDSSSSFDSNTEKSIINSKINKKKKQCFRVTNDLISEVKELLKLLKIPYITAQGEADCMCAYLYHHNYVDGALSDDLDFLVFGIKRVFFINPSMFEYVCEWNLNLIMRKLNMNYINFVNFCLLFNSDYIEPKINTDAKKVYDVYMEKKYNYSDTLIKFSSIFKTNNIDAIEKFMIIKDKVFNFYLSEWNRESVQITSMTRFNIKNIYDVEKVLNEVRNIVKISSSRLIDLILIINLWIEMKFIL